MPQFDRHNKYQALLYATNQRLAHTEVNVKGEGWSRIIVQFLTVKIGVICHQSGMILEEL